MKLPLPVQLVPPLNVQLPVMVLPLTTPDKVRVLPPGDPDCTFNPNLPATLPLKFPLRANEPLSVSPDTKHGEFVETPKLLMVRVPFSGFDERSLEGEYLSAVIVRQGCGPGSR